MRYDFDTKISTDRSSSAKWREMLNHNSRLGAEIVPLSVADMEFRNPPEVIEALRDFLKETTLGYAAPTEAYYDACLAWQKRRHGWLPERRSLVPTAGIVPAIFNAVRSLTEPGDGIIIQPPVYRPFRLSIQKNGRKLVENPLKIIEAQDGTHRYEMDFDDLEAKAADPNTKMLILCSPHNPVGRVWSAEELRRLLDACLEHDVIIVCDEIHDDLIMPGHEHAAIMCVADAGEYDKLLICTAASKTFNLAGCQSSAIYIPDQQLRERFCEGLDQVAQGGGLNAFAYVSTTAAYTRCDEWLDQLITYVQENYNFLKGYLARFLPSVEVYPMEGTYLAWVDFRSWSLSSSELESFMREDALLFLDEGHVFGTGGSGFERFNLACPRSVLGDSLERLVLATNTRGIPST